METADLSSMLLMHLLLLSKEFNQWTDALVQDQYHCPEWHVVVLFTCCVTVCCVMNLKVFLNNFCASGKKKCLFK